MGTEKGSAHSKPFRLADAAGWILQVIFWIVFIDIAVIFLLVTSLEYLPFRYMGF